MLKEAITHINTLLLASGMFEKVYGLCEIVEKEDKKFPAEYCLNKYIEVSNFDKYKGSVYHRLNGDIGIRQEEDETEGCGVVSEKTYPCILIGVVKKDLFKNTNNDSFIELSIIENIEALISSQNNSTITNSLDAETVSISVTSASYDRYEIFRKEYTNIEMKIPFEYAYISIGYNVIISQKLSCYSPVACE